jgi:hypothetical protein
MAYLIIESFGWRKLGDLTADALTAWSWCLHRFKDENCSPWANSCPLFWSTDENK